MDSVAINNGWRPLNQEECAIIAGFLAAGDFSGVIFVERTNGDVVPMVLERIVNELHNTEE